MRIFKSKPIRLFAFLLFMFFFVTACKNSERLEPPKAVQGVIDLSEWDFNKYSPIKLDGEWEFFWKEFLMDTVGLEESNSGFANVPGLWKDAQIKDKNPEKYGYASYRLKVKLNSADQLAIKYLNSATSCEIFIDGISKFSAGMPGKSKNLTQPSYKPAVVYFSPIKNETEIVLQISNFHHKKGGQWEPLTIGTSKQITQLRNRYLFIELLFIGSVFMMAIFHLLIFFKHPNEKPSLYFGLFALFISIRFIVSGEFTIYLLGDFIWNYVVKLDYVSFYLSMLFFTLFIRSLYPAETNKKIIYSIYTISTLFTLSAILFQPAIFSYGVLYFQLFIILGGLYVFHILYLAIKNKREGAVEFIAGFIMLFFCMVHDILNENEILYSISLGSAGLTLFILFKSSILSSRIRNALVANKNLSDELSLQNKEYAFLNEKYKQQNDKLQIAKEKAEQSDRFKSAFLANISHEIRTPMNGILGFASLLKTKDLTEKKREEYLEILDERGHHLLGVVNDIIDISKIETGQINIRNEVICLNDFLHELHQSYLPLMEKKGLQFNLQQTLSNHQSTIFADPVKLKQIMVNLISNAIKFTEKGQIEISYQLTKNELQFSIEDTGIGLSPDEIKIIFDRFNQANSKISHIYGGTGLGLAIVKAYVEKMGGIIWVKSTENVGSIFNFTIPYHPQVEIIKEKKTMTENSSSINHLVILLVEDNLTNAFLITEILSEQVKEILHAKDGAEAYDLYKANPQIDLVLMDIKLPDTNGYDLTKELLAFRGNVPFIAQTAFALKGDKEAAMKSGCVDHISKPIDSDELIEKIKIHTS